AVSLLAAFAANDYYPDALTYTAFSTLVPLNALLAFAFAERGLRFGRVWRWVALLALEAALVYVLQRSFEVQDDVLDNWLLRSPPTPLLGRLAFAVALAAALVRAWPSFTPIELGAAGALAAF